MRGGRFGLIAICLVGGALLPAAAGAATFTNPEALKTTPNSSDAYALLPYPSQIFVQGQQGTVTKATITSAARLRPRSAWRAPGTRSQLVTGRCGRAGRARCGARRSRRPACRRGRAPGL